MTRKIKRIANFILIGLITVGCNSVTNEPTLLISAIPDQNPEKLNRLYNLLAKRMSNKIDINVKYIPVSNYPAAVTAFKTGSIDLVWFGGLTGVQARLGRPGSKVIAQRNIDSKFHSVFIANKKSNIKKIESIHQLKSLKGKRFTFGSESSTSGRLMPQYYLKQAGVNTKDFRGGYAGFSGSHDATLALVQSGSFEAGALNEQIWKSNQKDENPLMSQVRVIWKTPPYVDYHWLIQPEIDNKLGVGLTQRIKEFFIRLDIKDYKDKQILDMFGAKSFISANKEDYKKIEEIGREIGKIR